MFANLEKKSLIVLIYRLTIFQETCFYVPKINAFSATKQDVLTLFDCTKSAEDNHGTQISDCCLEGFFSFLTKDKDSILYLTVGQMQVFQAFDPEKDLELEHKYSLEPFDTILMPSMIRTGHWSLIVYYNKIKEISLYDPYYNPCEKMCTSARKILRGFSAYYQAAGVEDASIQTFDTKVQTPGTLDCGAGVAYIAQCVCEGQKIEKVDLLYFRQQMQVQLLSQMGVHV